MSTDTIKRVNSYAVRYGVSHRKVRRMSVDLLDEMSDEARALLLHLPDPHKTGRKKRLNLGQCEALRRHNTGKTFLNTVIDLATKIERRVRGPICELVWIGPKQERKPPNTDKIERMMELATRRKA